MKTKINYRSKKTIIIVAIIAALILVASIGTVAYIKGNRKAAAATSEEQLNPTEGSVQATAPNTDESVSDDELPLLGETTENNDDTTTTDNGTTSNDTTTATTNNNAVSNANNNANGVNQEFTQTTVEIIERPWETSASSWTQITKTANLGASIDELEINKPNLEISKYAYMEADETEKNTAIQIGEKITYVIKVENKSEVDAKNIYVYDAVPAGTELVEKTSEDGNLSWKIDVPAGETVEIRFTVKVVEELKDGIKNIATVNGEETNPTETAIIDSNKLAQVIDDDGNIVNRGAKVGERIKYTITANNKTSVDGKTTIIDTVPEGTELVEESVSQDAEVTVKDGVTTIKWENTEVEANKSKDVSFEVTVKDISKSIKNIATIGNTKTEETETKVANIKTVKTSSPENTVIHENDEIVYTLTAANSGNAEGTVEISDIVPEGTTLVDAGNAVQSVDEETGRTKLTWNVTVAAGESEKLTFKVKVNPFTGADEKTIVNDKVKQDGEPVETKTENKVEKEYLSIEVNKDFVDSENVDGVRPTAITIGLYSNESNDTAITTYELKASEEWKHTFTGLDKYGIDSKEALTYEVREISMKDAKAEYTPTVSPENITAAAGKNEATITITNTLKYETVKTAVTVTKEWRNNNISEPEIPDSIAIVFTGNIEGTLYKNKNWTDTFELPKYNENKEVIEYSVEEKNVSKYVQISKTNTNNTITIVNAMPSINVVKEIVSVNGSELPNSNADLTQLTVMEGTVIGYKITVTNGLVDLTNVTVKDEMANSKTVYRNYAEGVVSDAITNGEVATIEKLPAEDVKTYFVYYKVDAEDVKNAETIDSEGNKIPATITNTAYAEAKYIDNNKEEQDVDTTYSEISVVVTDRPELTVTKTSDKSNIKVAPGDEITYTITVSNTGNTKQNNVTVTDTMNNNREATINTEVVIKDENNNERTVTATVNNGVISIGDLEVGETATIIATYVVSQEDMSENENTISNEVTVNSETPATEETSDTEDVITKAWVEDITLNKISNIANNSTVKYGDQITYTLSATNNGTAPGTAVLQDADLQELISSNKISATIENIVVNDFDENGNARTDSSKTSQDIIDGIEVYVPAKENDVAKVATLTFTATVTAKPGQEIRNSLATGEENEPVVIQQTEKDVLVKKQTSVPVVTNSNVVIVLDISGSMNDKMPNTNMTRLKAAQDACCEMIDGMFSDANSRCGVSVVTFSAEEEYEWWDLLQLFGTGTDNAKWIGTANNTSEADSLKAKVNALEASGGTRIAHGLSVAQSQIEELNRQKPENKNIVVVLSDGTFNISNDGDTLESSAGERKSRVTTYATNLKNSTANPTVYSIAFGTSETAIMRDIIASDESTYIPSGDSYAELIAAFRKAVDDIQGGAISKITTNGKIYLTDINVEKEVEIRVKDSNGTLVNQINDTIANIPQIKSDTNGYYLDLTEFEAQSIVEIDYISE